MVRLSMSKVIPCIEEYIREAYKASGLAAENKPLCVYGTVSVRDMICAVLCSRAVGKDNIRFYCHKPSVGKKRFIDLGLDFDEYCLFKYYVKPKKDPTNNWITSKVGVLTRTLCKMDYHTPHNTDEYNIFDHFESMHRAEANNDLSVVSTNFGYQMMLQAAEDNCKELRDKYGSAKTENVIYPLYWFTDDEVSHIGFMLGISNDWWILREYPSFQYRDTARDRALKYALAHSYNLAKMDRDEVFKNKMNHIPSCKHIHDSLTYFYMGQYHGCYKEFK